jgi:hypothetical protein
MKQRAFKMWLYEAGEGDMLEIAKLIKAMCAKQWQNAYELMEEAKQEVFTDSAWHIAAKMVIDQIKEQ